VSAVPAAEPHDPLETLCIHALHGTRCVSVYDVRCRPHDKHRGPVERPLTHQIVFPRRGVFEFESRGAKLTADANQVLFFNRDQEYQVAHPVGGGDDCTVFAFDDRVLCDALTLVDPRWLDGAGNAGASHHSGALARPFRFVHGLNDERTFWAHERLRRAAQAPHAESLAVDEAAVELLCAVLQSAYRGRAQCAKPARLGTRVSHAEAVHRACLFLATRFDEKASLDDVGRAAHASPFHLARLFRREVGLTIHQYRHRLRLRAALARITDGETNLSALALELGFSSHSHLTDAFRLAFGMSPAECRKSLRISHFREMSRDLEVRPRAKS
jgi:AraC family transcriptional regulator